MNKMERLEKLEQFFQAIGGEITGRKKVHKLVYLCQELGIDLGQDFVFHYYGVYSPGLSRDLQQAKVWGSIYEKAEGVGYKLGLAEKNVVVHESLQAVNKQVETLASKSPAVLEVLSTIVFLNNEGYTNKRILEKLLELKGHLKQYFEEAEVLARDIFNIDLNERH